MLDLDAVFKHAKFTAGKMPVETVLTYDNGKQKPGPVVECNVSQLEVNGRTLQVLPDDCQVDLARGLVWVWDCDTGETELIKWKYAKKM